MKRHLIDLLSKSGTLGVINFANRSANRILTYHGISSSEERSLMGTEIPVINFEEQLAWLTRQYRVVPLAELDRYQGAVAITFDDGSLSNVTRALPILERHRVKATFFVCSAMVLGEYPTTWDYLTYLGVARSTAGSRGTSADFRQLVRSRAQAVIEKIISMGNVDPYDEVRRQFQVSSLGDIISEAASWDAEVFASANVDALKELVRHGHSVQSHTHRHLYLSNYPIGSTLEKELLGSKEIIEELSCAPVTALAIPYGEPNSCRNDIEELAFCFGYEKVFYSALLDRKPTRSIVGRMCAPTGSSVVHLYAITSGAKLLLQHGSLLDTGGRIRSLATYRAVCVKPR